MNKEARGEGRSRIKKASKWGVVAILGAAMFIIVIDTTIMNVSISALVEDLNTTVGGVQAAISIYALVMASFILIGGKLADIVGKKRTFIVGLILTGGLSNRKLVGAQGEEDVAEAV